MITTRGSIFLTLGWRMTSLSMPIGSPMTWEANGFATAPLAVEPESLPSAKSNSDPVVGETLKELFNVALAVAIIFFQS